jgi:hypothetical protein
MRRVGAYGSRLFLWLLPTRCDKLRYTFRAASAYGSARLEGCGHGRRVGSRAGRMAGPRRGGQERGDRLGRAMRAARDHDSSSGSFAGACHHGIVVCGKGNRATRNEVRSRKCALSGATTRWNPLGPGDLEQSGHGHSRGACDSWIHRRGFDAQRVVRSGPAELPGGGSRVLAMASTRRVIRATQAILGRCQPAGPRSTSTVGRPRAWL